MPSLSKAARSLERAASALRAFEERPRVPQASNVLRDWALAQALTQQVVGNIADRLWFSDLDEGDRGVEIVIPEE